LLSVKTSRFAAGLAFLAVAAGCTLVPGATETLDGTWQLTRGVDHGEAVPIVEPGSITMRVDGSEIGGRAACNIYGGTIEVGGDLITISALSMTEMACEEDRMASEAAYLAAIGVVETAERTDDRLVLAGPDVELHYRLEPPIADASLAGTLWRLDSLVTADAVSSTMSDDATLELAEDGTISGFTGCRSFSGRYEVVGSAIEIRNLVNDDRRCPAELQAQDDHVLGALRRVLTLAIGGNRLTLTSRDGGLGLGYTTEPLE